MESVYSNVKTLCNAFFQSSVVNHNILQLNIDLSHFKHDLLTFGNVSQAKLPISEGTVSETYEFKQK